MSVLNKMLKITSQVGCVKSSVFITNNEDKKDMRNKKLSQIGKKKRKTFSQLHDHPEQQLLRTPVER